MPHKYPVTEPGAGALSPILIRERIPCRALTLYISRLSSPAISRVFAQVQDTSQHSRDLARSHGVWLCKVSSKKKTSENNFGLAEIKINFHCTGVFEVFILKCSETGIHTTTTSTPLTSYKPLTGSSPKLVSRYNLNLSAPV